MQLSVFIGNMLYVVKAIFTSFSAGIQPLLLAYAK